MRESEKLRQQGTDISQLPALLTANVQQYFNNLFPANLSTVVENFEGVGFDPNGNSEGLGLRIMRYRAELLGGNLQVRSAPGETTVLCSIGSL